MAITADWQAELRTVTIGAGTDYPFTTPVSGLGIPAVRSRDLELADRHGSHGGAPDRLLRRILQLPVGVDGSTPADAYTKLHTLKSAWRPADSDEPFDLRLPGQPTTVVRYYGRPRAVDVDLRHLRSGWADALLTFEALDPYAYGPTDTATVVTTLAVTNAGTVATDRITLVLEGNGGTPVITNTTAGGTIEFVSALALGVTRTLDVRARTMVDAGGADVYHELTAATSWFDLAPGANTITLSGAASVDVTWRPAWI